MHADKNDRKDRELTVFLKDGETRRTTYRKLLETLGLAETIVDGEPMSAGTEFQAHYVGALLAVEFREVEMVRVKEICYASKGNH